MANLLEFVKRFCLQLTIINLSVLFFMFYSGLLTKIDASTLVGVLILVGINALFYFAFANEKRDEQETEEDIKKLEEQTTEIENRRDQILSKLNDRDKKMFQEFEEELKRLPLEQRTDKNADEIMMRLRKKYEK